MPKPLVKQYSNAGAAIVIAVAEADEILQRECIQTFPNTISADDKLTHSWIAVLVTEVVSTGLYPTLPAVVTVNPVVPFIASIGFLKSSYGSAVALVVSAPVSVYPNTSLI